MVISRQHGRTSLAARVDRDVRARLRDSPEIKLLEQQSRGFKLAGSERAEDTGRIASGLDSDEPFLREVVAELRQQLGGADADLHGAPAVSHVAAEPGTGRLSPPLAPL